MLSYKQLYTWLYIALKTEWLEGLCSRHYTVKMAVSQHFKIEVLPNILPAGEEIESDAQQSADDTMVTVGENMGTMLFKPHLIVSKHCCLKSNTAILILAWNLIAAIGLKFASNPIMVTVTPLSAPIDSLIPYQ